MAMALAVAGLALPALTKAACQIESLEMPVKMEGSRAVATIGINGTPVPMTVDSGAFYSNLTDAAAAQLKLTTKRDPRLLIQGLTGAVEARTASVEKVSLLKGDIGGMEFVVGGNELGAGTMGLIGRNILSFADTEYDLAHGTIRFLFPNDDCAKSNMAYWAGATPVTEVELVPDYQTKVPAIRAEIKLNGKKFVALFDTGATTLVSARATRTAGVPEGDWKPVGSVYGLGRGSAKAWTVAFDTFQIGGETIRHNRLEVADFDLDDAEMLLGIDFFLSHRIYVSKKQSKIFITYNGGPVFALDRTVTAKASGPAADPSGADAEAVTADQFARRGAASAARRDYERALADLDRACALDPTSAAHFTQRSAIHEKLEHHAEALADADKALELDPTEVDARIQRAHLRVVAKNNDGAKVDLDALDKQLPPQAQMRFAMSLLYSSLQQRASEIAQLDLWLAAHPNDLSRGAAFNDRCWARVMLGTDLEKALDDCDEAVDSDAKNSAYLDSRGWVYARLGKDEKAVADFDRSLENRPGNASSLYGRGLAKKRLGKSAEGEVDLATARKARPDIDVEMAPTGLTHESTSKRAPDAAQPTT